MRTWHHIITARIGLKEGVRVYLLDKQELKQYFKDYQDLSDKLDYANWKTIFDNPKRPYNKILNDDVYVCPEGLKDRLYEHGYIDCCFDVTDLLLDLIIVGEKAFNNTVRIIAAIMISGLVIEDKPIVYWSVDDIRKYAKLYFNDDPVNLQNDAVKYALCDRIFIKSDRGYSLDVKLIAQMTYNVKPKLF